eukprot:TRINITY_DN1942_c1_g1_i1.p1 TRINITY_DN1942_c1_g1~~TRINITY_DN1942_c1_g1_i1.p1  ORF type:complete len:314 (+),score=59.11 TRINITY_DN1942_c1_g1_i1:54-944(+)
MSDRYGREWEEEQYERKRSGPERSNWDPWERKERPRRSHHEEKNDRRKHLTHDRSEDSEENEQEESIKAILLKDSKKDVRTEELNKMRKQLEEECQQLEWTLKARVGQAKRLTKQDETFVWVLVEYDNYGCERYLDGYGVLPGDWKVLLFRNKNAVGFAAPVVRSCVIKSQRGGKGKAAKDEKSSLTFPTVDLCFTAGEIARRAVSLGIQHETTIYFVFSPLTENSRYHQLMVLLEQLGVRSFSFDGQGSLDEIIDREGIDKKGYKTNQHHRPPPKSRSRSRGPSGSKRSASAGLR